MTSYIGTRCIVCSEKFGEEDDVVICPQCGTPYHRECYKKEGNCVNTFLHEKNRSWTPSYDVGASAAGEDAVCRFCGTENPPDSIFCRKCGMPTSNLQSITVNGRQIYNGSDINIDPNAYNSNANGNLPFTPFLVNFSDPLCGYDPNEDMDGVKMSELGEFVGTNTHYYLPVFKRFKERGGNLSYNFSAMIFPELYFSYRKMPLFALAALIMRFVSNLPQFIYFFAKTEGYGLLSSFASLFNVNGTAFHGVLFIGSAIFYALMFTAGFFGNRLYYGSALKKIKRAKSVCPEGERPRLDVKGGTSGLWLALFICLMALPYAAIYIMQLSVVMMR